jgi:hypothetical protein
MMEILNAHRGNLELIPLSQSSDNNGEHQCGENVSEFEKDMLLAFIERGIHRLILPTPHILNIPSLSRRNLK